MKQTGSDAVNRLNTPQEFTTLSAHSIGFGALAATLILLQFDPLRKNVRQIQQENDMTLNIHRIAILVVLFFIASGVASGQENMGTIAFPGAEGYGRFAKGGRGGDVYTVTNLNDSGKGSLRFGIEQQKGPRTIVFAVSGTIPLRSPMEFTKSYLTIAGQTAPGDGICIKDYGLKFSNVNNIIMRYIRIRLGDQNKGDSSGADCITSSKISDVIFDHISSGWGIDAIHDNREGGDFTLQWSIYGETLHDSIHYERGPHSKLGSFRETTKNISLHHNLFHSTHDRHPSMGGGHDTPEHIVIDFRNNLIYNSGGTTNLGSGRRNVINNLFKNGPDTDVDDLPLRIKAKPNKGPQPTGFASGNIFTWNRSWTADNYSAIQYVQDGDKYLSTTRATWELPRELVFGSDKPATESADEAYRRILQYAGASKSRDACDQRIIKEVQTSSGKVPDSQDDVGGWPTLKSLPPPTDFDKDGMADDWETANGLDPNDAEDRNRDRDSDGFTNLEEYINSLTAEKSILELFA